MITIKRCTETGFLTLNFNYLGLKCVENTQLQDTHQNRKVLSEKIKVISFEMITGIFSYSAHFPFSNLQYVTAAIRYSDAVKLPTFAQYADSWLHANTSDLAPFVKRKVEQIITHYLIPALGERCVEAITASCLLNLRMQLSDKVAEFNFVNSARNLNFIVRVATHILQDAAKTYSFNPIDGVSALSGGKKDFDPFSRNEMEAILRSVPVILYEFFTVLFYTGMSCAELYSLQWQDIDFKYGFIRVRSVLEQNSVSQFISTPAARDVVITPQIHEVLRRQQVKTGNAKFVFTSGKNLPFKHKTIASRMWFKALKNADVRHRNIHQCRLTAARVWIEQGFSIQSVAVQLGGLKIQHLFALQQPEHSALTDQKQLSLFTSSNSNR
ncbi:tyrosine-type recombinase/integrase [Rheinheimera salexigens]|uniref:Tyr recombinase domain-containing protein n=1 Tax=Rheinheimera salexigens TaxID=1628148 RepID=A0A1E7Q7D3_9GAMM|nr:tyrosine-type recombinase/integrase [Rheinheimera salexigens]OEY70095.1 hypothetical protein BI198_11345 [Rheinheimera salexigens]